MKPRILSVARLSLPLATALAALLASSAAMAQTNGTWDGGGATAIWGGANNWNPNNQIANGAGATATFGTAFTSGTNIQVNTARTVGNINHNSATTDITISQINSSVFTLDVTTGSPTVTVGTAARTLTITAPISGNDGLTKAGAGTLILSGLNLFSGNVTVSAGTLVAGIAGTGGNSALGGSLGSKTINVNTGGTLRFDVGNVFNNNFASAATSVPTLSIAGGTLTNGGAATNSALGNITLAGGTLTATVGSASGYGSWNLNGTVTSTGTSLISSSAGVPITLSATSDNTNTTTFNVQSGTLTASAALGEVTAAGDERISNLTKSGAGTLVLSGVNTYTGNTAINAGTLTLATKDALPGYNTSGRYTVASGATLAVQNGVLDSEIAEMLATTNFQSGANLGFDTAAGSRDFPLNLADTANGPLGLVKLGANTLTLSGTNTHTGGTQVLAGGLNLPSTSALPGWNVDGGFSVASGASLVIPNTISELEVTTILGTTNIASGATISFDTSLGNRVYTSAVTDSLQGLLNVQKIGDNALTLAAANTYTGSTTVSSGTLNITGSLTGDAASSKLNIAPPTGNAIVNYNGGNSTLFAVTGATAVGTASVLNMSGGTVTISPGVATGTQSVAGAGNLLGVGGYGYYNITGGTFKDTQRFTMTGQATASATTGPASGLQTAVVFVGGADGFIDQTNGEWWLNYSLGQVTVADSGKIDRTGSSAPFGIIMNHAANVTGGGYGVLNLAGANAQVILGAQPIRYGNSTTSTAGSGQSGFVNVAAGTLSVGANASVSLPAAPVAINNGYYNFAGGTVLATGNLSGWIPTSNASINFNSNIFGAIDNSALPGAPANFTGGMTVDSNSFDVTIANPLQAPGGAGVTQADLVTTPGSDYVGAPAVIFSSTDVLPGGTPAAGYALISGGAVTGIVITSPGTYVTGTIPTVTLVGGGGTGASVTSSALNTANTSGGLTKAGAGFLTLSGANTYTGATAVNAGTLNLTGSLTSNVTVANNANLAGEGSTTGSLTFSGTSELGFDPSTVGTFLSANTVNATGAAVRIVPTIPLTGTGIVVLDAPGGITGTAGGVGNNFFYTGRGSLYISGTQLLIDTAPLSLAWRGNDGTNPTFWDLNTTTNWDAGAAEKYFTADAVTFDDTASSYTVDINAADVFPGNITFNNTANTYTVQGAFGIYGGATLTKDGTGTTVINTSNGYTGATTVNAGVLNIGNANALGSVAAGTTVADGAALEIQGGIITPAEALTLNGSGISNNGALRSISGDNTWGTAVALGSASTIGTDADKLTIPSLTGAFGLTKVGAGTLNITGATAVTSTTVEAGTLYMGAQSGASTTTTLGAANPVTLNGSSNLTIRRTNTGVSNLLGAISGTGSLTLLGDNATTRAASDFALNDASDFSGGTTVIGARANITTSGSALGTGPVTTGANGQFFVQTANLTVANDLVIGGIGWDETSGYLGAVRLNGTTLTGDISLTSNARITGAGTSVISGTISGGFGMDFFEDTVIGTISLSGDNDYTGETVVNSVGGGTTFPSLLVASNTALGTTAAGTIVNGSGTTNNGSQLILADGITVTDETLTLNATASGYRASLITASNATATWDGNVVTAGTGGFLAFNANGATSNLTVGSSDADTITGTTTIAMRGAGNGTVNSSINIGTFGIFKTDASVWTITSNNNDFTGAPSIAGGVLSVSTIADAGVNSPLGAGTLISLGQNSTAIGTLRFTGASGGSSNRDIRIANGTNGSGGIENAVSGQTLTLSGEVTSNTPANAHSLTLTGDGDGLLSGTITGSPAMAMVKSGAGTWEVSGNNTHTGATTVTGGTLKLTGDRSGVATGTTAVGGTSAILDISGDIPMGATQFQVGNATGGGTVNQSAGDITFASGNQLTVGTNAANLGTYNLSGGTFTTATQGNRGVIIGVNANCAGIFNLSGTGVLDVVSGSSLQIGRSENVAGAGANGTFAQTGGTATVSDLRMGGNAAVNNANQVATLDVSAGTFTATGFTALSGGDGSASTINISGTAEVTLPAFPTTRGTGATATITFDGGTLKNSAASPAYMGGLTEARIKAGGAKIDTAAGDITVSQPLLEDALSTGGGLNKAGINTLTLTGANTYTGATLVSDGVLALVGGSQTSAITLEGGTSLGFTPGSTTSSTATVTFNPGSTVTIIGTPTLASYTLMTAASFDGITPVLSTPVAGYELMLDGTTTLKLVQLGYGAWAAVNGAGVNLDDDHDGDGVSNGIEYFIGGPAGNTTGFTPLPGVVDTAGVLSITWPKGAGYAGVYGTDFEVETSATLSGTWTTETLGGGNITDTGTSVKYTFPGPLSGKNFARLKVTGP